MTSLRSFQNEIDQIHNKEVARQRQNSSNSQEKENKNPAERPANIQLEAVKEQKDTEDPEDSNLDSELQVC